MGLLGRENLATAVPMRVAYHDVVAAATVSGSPLAHPHLHCGDYNTLGAEPLDVIFQLVPGVVPRLADQFGPAGDLWRCLSPSVPGGWFPVIVPRRDRDAEYEPGGYAARHESAWRNPARTPHR